MRKLGTLRVSRHALAAIAILGVALWSNQSRADDPFPAHAVRIVVPSAPGSTTDTLARIVADQLARKWAKAVIGENVAGGPMNAGAANATRAPPARTALIVGPAAALPLQRLRYRGPRH